jgi:hypothetical protein
MQDPKHQLLKDLLSDAGHCGKNKALINQAPQCDFVATGDPFILSNTIM